MNLYDKTEDVIDYLLRFDEALIDHSENKHLHQTLNHIGIYRLRLMRSLGVAPAQVKPLREGTFYASVRIRGLPIGLHGAVEIGRCDDEMEALAKLYDKMVTAMSCGPARYSYTRTGNSVAVVRVDSSRAHEDLNTGKPTLFIEKHLGDDHYTFLQADFQQAALNEAWLGLACLVHDLEVNTSRVDSYFKRLEQFDEEELANLTRKR